MRRRLLVSALIAVLAGACGDDHHGPSPVLRSISLQGRSRIAPGESESFTATGVFTDGSTQDYTTRVSWLSTNALVITIAGNGTATARGTGEATVTAGFGNFRSSLNVMVVPSGTYRLTGTVTEAGLPVAGATVKVSSGIGTGVSTSTDGLGRYRLYGVAGEVEIEITKAGYAPLTKSVAINRDDLLDFPELTQTGALQSLAGTYTLTLSMAAGCRLEPRGAQYPDEAKTRTYTAVITQSGPRLLVTLSGADFLIQNAKGNAFEGRLEPGSIRFNLRTAGGYAYDYYYYYYVGIPDIAERLSTGDYLSFLGKVIATTSSAGLSGGLQGTAMLFARNGAGVSTIRGVCHSSQHGFSLTPQTAATRHRR